MSIALPGRPRDPSQNALANEFAEHTCPSPRGFLAFDVSVTSWRPSGRARETADTACLSKR